MRERSAFGGLPLFGIAVAGVMLGHWLAYNQAIPRPSLRLRILVAAGHAYWHDIVKFAVVAVIAALGSVVLRHICNDVPLGPRVQSYAWILRRLAPLQIAAFTAMEITERLASGAPVTGMFHYHLFFAGVAMQFLVASVGALLLLLLASVARLVRVSASPRSTTATTPAWIPSRSPAEPTVLLLDGAVGVRGPPTS